MLNKISNTIIPPPDRHSNGFIDLTGKNFGNCTVLYHYGTEIVGIKSKKSIWACRCVCGNDFLVRGNSLRTNRTTSCGCISKLRLIQYNKENKTKISYNSFSDVLSSYKTGAKLRGISFELTREEFLELTTGNCHYCGVFPNKFRRKRSNLKGCIPEFYHNGIDRVDSSKGYFMENCVSCCTTCNRMKRSLSLGDFILHIKKIHSYLRLDV